MKQRNVLFLMKKARRKDIRKSFQKFYADVQIRKSRICKDDMVVICKHIWLSDEMMLESPYSIGIGNDLQKATVVGHFIHAYLQRWGVNVDKPYEDTNGNFVFYISGAYRGWTR